MLLFDISVSDSSPELFPTQILEGLLLGDDNDSIVISNGNVRKPQWGRVNAPEVISIEKHHLPKHINLTWIALTEKVCYHLDSDLDSLKAEIIWNTSDRKGRPCFNFIVVGMAPYGKVALWLVGLKKSVLFSSLIADKYILDEEDEEIYLGNFSLEEHCSNRLSVNKEVMENLIQHGLPAPHLFDRMMQQFTYRFLPVLKKWDDDNQLWIDYAEDEKQPELDYVEVKCHDGTFDRLRDGSLLSYHQAGKPCRVCVGWHVGKREYSAYFFFSHDELAQVFRNCYGAHPDTKVDFLLQIDPESDKYESALFRYGMKEPLAIGPDACQVLAFRNKFECYRSPNYTQPKGAWR